MRQQEPSKGLLQFWHRVFGWCDLRSYQADLSRLLVRQFASPASYNTLLPTSSLPFVFLCHSRGSGNPQRQTVLTDKPLAAAVLLLVGLVMAALSGKMDLVPEFITKEPQPPRGG